MKPKSIQLFDRLYLGALAISLITTIVFWNQTVQLYLAQPGSRFGSGFLVGTTAAGFLISLLLWFFTSQRASNVAKWILTLLTGIGLVGFVIGLGGGPTVGGAQLVMGLVGMLLQLAAVWMLFRPDSKAWFSGRSVDPGVFQ